MNKLYYPAIFQKEDIGYSVWLPDIPGCNSQGDTLDEAMTAIKDALGLFVEDYREEGHLLPAPTEPGLHATADGQFIAIIEFDFMEYMKRHSSKTVKKTLSIPGWLNTLAEEQGINFSGVLQQALIEQLQSR